MPPRRALPRRPARRIHAVTLSGTAHAPSRLTQCRRVEYSRRGSRRALALDQVVDGRGLRLVPEPDEPRGWPLPFRHNLTVQHRSLHQVGCDLLLTRK
jgi:hypothetical protein